MKPHKSPSTIHPPPAFAHSHPRGRFLLVPFRSPRAFLLFSSSYLLVFTCLIPTTICPQSGLLRPIPPCVRSPITPSHLCTASIVLSALPNFFSRRLHSYEDQYDALKANLDLFKLEGAGQLYVTTCIDETDVQAFRSGTLTAPTLREKLSFKLGHTSSLACRQYRKCENGQTHLWLWSYNVDQQYIAGVYLIFFSFSFSYSHWQNG